MFDNAEKKLTRKQYPRQSRQSVEVHPIELDYAQRDWRDHLKAIEISIKSNNTSILHTQWRIHGSRV